MVALPGPSVAPVDEIQMKPCFMMATLISRKPRLRVLLLLRVLLHLCAVHSWITGAIGCWMAFLQPLPSCLTKNVAAPSPLPQNIVGTTESAQIP